MTRTRTGFFISLEGADGVGKSSQVRRLAAYLRLQGRDVIVTREPGGGGEGAEAIRALLLKGDVERWTPMAEALMMFAARAEHLDRLIRPALVAGKTVITDRFADSSMAYQGMAGGVGEARIRTLHGLVVGSDDPDLTIILDAPAKVAMARAERRVGGEGRFEAKGLDYQARVRTAFLTIAKNDPLRCALVDASPDEETVWQSLVATVDAALQRRQ